MSINHGSKSQNSAFSGSNRPDDNRNQGVVEVEDTDITTVVPEVSMLDAFKEIKTVADKLGNVDKLNQPVGMINNVILAMRQSGVYRNNDTILVAQAYSMVVSTKDGEQIINLNQSMLTALISLTMAGVDERFMQAFSQAVEMLYLEHDDFIAQPTNDFMNLNQQ